MNTYENKKIIIIGLGLSGKSAAKFLLSQKAHVHAVDRNYLTMDLLPLIKAGMTCSCDNKTFDMTTFDLVVLSPGIPQTHPIVKSALQIGLEVIGEIELGCRQRYNPILGVTGTNGKTTVTLLVAHVLNNAGIKAHALGNVGQPFTEEILQIDPKNVIVLELSSYQLETLNQKVLTAGVLLNITPDHLDRYGSMGAYAAAKCHMQSCLKEEGTLYVENSVKNDYGDLLDRTKLSTYGYTSDSAVYSDLYDVYFNGLKVFSVPKDLQSKKSHDLENLMAAYALCQKMDISGEQFLAGYQTFQKPAHRIQFVLEHAGVRYFDDSKGTNIDAVIRAVQTFDEPIILIAGGVDKGAPYTPWIKEFKGKVKCIYAIGEASHGMQEQLSTEIPVEIITDLEHAVERAALFAKKGDVVLLSPGCSSFDMFRDYVHRGEVYQGAVRRITGERVE